MTVKSYVAIHHRVHRGIVIIVTDVVVAHHTAGEIDVMKKSSIRTGGTSAVPPPS